MKNTLKDVFRTNTAGDLAHRVLARINQEQIHQAKIRFGIYISGSIASLGFFVLALRYAAQEFGLSEFPRLASLVYSDASLLTTYWKDLSYAFVESVPFVSIVLVLLAATAMLWAIRKTMENVGVKNHKSVLA